MAQNSSDFSFDLYPGLDRELDDVYRRNLEQGIATGEAAGTTALAGAVNNTLIQQTPETKLSDEALAWARSEIGDTFDGTLNSWYQYQAALESTVPRDLGELLEGSPHGAETIERLFDAKQALDTSGEMFADNMGIGETMHLVLVPWKAMRDNVENFAEWVTKIRTAQGITTNDYWNDDLLRRVEQEVGGLYRDPDHPDQLMSAKRYLDLKIERDGPWGIMLTQISNDAGIMRLTQGPANERTPNALTANGTQHFEIAGQQVDGLGIFEWIALTFQESPNELSSRDASWLLANRFDVNGDPYVPIGFWYDGQVKSYLYDASDDFEDWRPRLAVL